MSRTVRTLVPLLALFASVTPSAAWLPTGMPVNQSHTTVTGSAGRLVTVSDTQGGMFVAWSDSRNGNFDIYLQRLDNLGQVVAGWPTNGLAVCNAAGDQTRPSAVVDGSGGVYLVWNDRRSGSDDIYAQRILASGSVATGWPANGKNITSSSAQIQPFGMNSDPKSAAVTDGAGGFYVAWSERRNGLDYDIYAQHMTGAGTPFTGWATDGQWVSVLSGDQTEPMIVPVIPDPRATVGSVMVAWLSDSQIWVQNINTSGGPFYDWPPEGIYIGAASAGSTIDLKEVATDASGSGVYTFWTESLVGYPYSSLRYNYKGARWDFGYPAFIEEGVTLTYHTHSDVTADDVFVSWYDQAGSGLWSLKLMKTSFCNGCNGLDPSWPGLSPTDASGFDLASTASPVRIGLSTKIGPFGSSYCCVTSAVVSSNSRAYCYNEYAQRAPGWPAAGLDFTGDPAGQPSSLSEVGTLWDPAGAGALIGWVDWRNGSTALDVYAQRISTAGMIAPCPLTPLSLSAGFGKTTTTTTFTLPADACFALPLAWEVRVASSAITTEAAWNAAATLAMGSDAQGTTRCIQQAYLPSCTYYYFAARYTDRGIQSGLSNSPGGKTRCSGSIEVECGSAAHAAREEDAPDALQLALFVRGANPATSTVALSYVVPSSDVGAPMRLGIFDVSGRLVRSLESGAAQAGRHEASWHLLDDAGHAAGRGLYFARFVVGREVRTRTIFVNR